MATDPLTTRFPGVSFSCGTNPSRVLGFDFPSGVDGAYDVLGLSEGDEEEVVLGKTRAVLKSNLRAWHRALPAPCTSLGAISIIAASRARPKDQNDSQISSPYDSILGQLYAFEILSLLSLFQLPIPGGAARWSNDNATVAPILLPNAFLDWKHNEMDGSFAPNIVCAVHYGRLEDCELWGEGDDDDDNNDLRQPVFTTDQLLRIVQNGPVVRLDDTGAMKGLAGISRAQLRQLKRGAGARGGGMFVAPASVVGGVLPHVGVFTKRSSTRATKKGKGKGNEGKEGKETESTSTSTSIPVSVDDLVEVGENERKQDGMDARVERIDEGLRRLDDKIERLNDAIVRRPDVNAGVQTDLVPVDTPDPVFITRPSSPVFLPAPPSSHKDARVDKLTRWAAEVEALKKETEALKKQNERQKQELDERNARIALLETRQTLASHLVEAVEPFLLPLVQRSYSLIPLPRIVKDALFDRAETAMFGEGEKGSAGLAAEVIEGMGGRLKTLVEGEKAFPAPPLPPPPFAAIDPLILPHLRLSSPSVRASFVIERLAGQVQELSGRLRTKRDENVDLLVQLAHLALDFEEERKGLPEPANPFASNQPSRASSGQLTGGQDGSR